MSLFTYQGIFPISFEKTRDKMETFQNTAAENKFFEGVKHFYYAGVEITISLGIVNS